jgi:hypothetical protein
MDQREWLTLLEHLQFLPHVSRYSCPHKQLNKGVGPSYPFHSLSVRQISVYHVNCLKVRGHDNFSVRLEELNLSCTTTP